MDTGVDLTTCDREPIHHLGAVQSFGFLIAITSDWIIARASANIADHLGQDVESLVGTPLAKVMTPEALSSIRATLQGLQHDDTVERVYRAVLVEGGAEYDLAVHLSDRLIVIEGEPADHEQMDALSTVRSMIGRLQRTEYPNGFWDEAARQMRALVGFDRVMLYRFAHDGSGEVIAEHKAKALEPFLGLRYPASDIPKQARALYLRSWLRLIADVDDASVPVLPQLGSNQEPLDLSLSVLRTVSPIHLEYLSNMGVKASLSVSIIVDGKLWGLFACHHRTPRQISLERRTAAELFGQMFSWVLDGRERERETEIENRGREVHSRLISAVVAQGTTLDPMMDQLDTLSELVNSDGVGVWIDGEIKLSGATPTREEFTGLVRFLNTAPAGEPFVTNELSRIHPPAADYTERAAGILSIPISRHPRDYLVFFRRELARSVTWAGNPEKPVTVGPNGVRLTPRKSFDAWREVIRGQSAPWTPAELRMAEHLRVTMLEVILRVTDAAERERKAGQARQELLIAELNHRVRNILGLIRGLVTQSRSGVKSVEDFAENIGGRIQSLARAHDLLTTQSWGAGSLRSLIETEVAAYLSDASERVRLSGPEVGLEPQALSIVALVLHEMLTNAAKYGALVDQSGRVDVSWALDEMGRLDVRWRETGGPPVQPPTRRGFGTTVIERSIPFELKGEAELRHELTGVEARFVIPALYVTEQLESGDAPGKAANTEAHVEDEGALNIGSVLVVEDNMLIAMDAEDMLLELGVDKVELASNVADATLTLDSFTPEVALLDVNLGKETSIPVAERLEEMGIPYAFTTGYGEAIQRPDSVSKATVIAKPYTRDILKKALAALR